MDMFNYCGSDSTECGNGDAVMVFFSKAITTENHKEVKQFVESINDMDDEQIFKLIDKDVLINKIQEYTPDPIELDELVIDVECNDKEAEIIFTYTY